MIKRYDKETFEESKNGEIVYFDDVKEYLLKVYKALDTYSIRYTHDYLASNISERKVSKILEALDAICKQ